MGERKEGIKNEEKNRQRKGGGKRKSEIWGEEAGER